MDFKIIVIEDEFSINDILTFALKGEGYKVKSASSSKEAREFLQDFKPNLVLLDINLPDESGFELCKFINANYKIPIIMLTARNDITDKVLGLELGADDYITKPFHIKEVLVRVKIALRRVDKYRNLDNYNDFINLNDSIKIKLENRMVIKDGKEIKLKPKEYDLLVFFIKNKNRVFTREEILDKVWGIDYCGEIRTVDIHVRRLRAKLNLDSGQSFIETVFGVGYVMR
ncbi:XRE family transcriptional regulator [Clostridium carboxidivorans P7]|uniref:Stage 0 sporulation protein A homolog n=1 Tax=Clostridium carboxidivorans P7 TaxID=536227 RepID=C6PYH4_9CLOT|nr:response regulator transcription factor [Clostridium carboxidivorans]AKN29723.1 XRE family transcriptional regulator [Clostridium carboxidivorans P7]EET85693.1 two component transcriptional regulator, winged helix family [Clostridium carboxidivorans P7]EFG89334.1 response regulator receiver domain protein [Clostridium carboxidivorans P7]